ncbi:2-C-methyl-D-erythritol 4-phosphate cytidylyltransferase [Bradyrhizobium lupini]|uniref:2-C-methyl-D-erythritol 4-phosphate cytidylyltransferase n=1 Tax=Rhizobium lupini TaxID=136996 RepID=UPI0034C63286
MAARPGRPRCSPVSKRSPAHKPDIVLIHDAARPFVSEGVITGAIDAASRTGAAIPVVPVTETMKITGGE